MSKRKIEVIYNPELDKNELYYQAGQEIKEIYKSLKQSHLDEKDEEIFKIYSILDNNKDNYFRLLFFLSLYCSYFHKIKHKIDVKKLSDVQHECYKKHNFYILDIDDNHKEIFNALLTYFNTDATNLELITGKILHDLYSIDVQYKKDYSSRKMSSSVQKSIDKYKKNRQFKKRKDDYKK